MFILLANKLLRLIRKLLPKKEYHYVAKVSEEDAIRNINYLAHSLRKVSGKGVGIPLFSISFALKQGYKTILLKEKKGIAVFSFEKWLKENYRAINGKMKEVYDQDFLSLPHVDGTPRVIILAEYIVNVSGGAPDRRQIEGILHAFNSITPLTYVEMEALRVSIEYILLREISILAEKCTMYYDSYLDAYKKRSKGRDRDSYCYFYDLLHSKDGVDVCEDIDASRLAFENVLAASENLISLYIDSLRKMDQSLPDDLIVRLSKVNAIYASDEDYRSMSHIAQRDYLLETYLIAKECKTGEIAVANAVMSLATEYKQHFGKILYKQKGAIRAYLHSGRIVPLKNETKHRQGIYCAAVTIISFLIAAFPAYYLRCTEAYLSVLPLFIISLHPVEYLLKRVLSLRGSRKPLPEMEYTKLPDKCSTIVIVSRFIRDKDDIDDAVRQIETLACSYRDANVSYAVVADLPSSEEEFTAADEKLLAYIETIKLSPNVAICIRKRMFRRGKWVAYERKRGALLEFLSGIVEGDFSRFFIVGEQKGAHYAVLLDDDSEVLPGTIRSAIFAMAHPLNEGYDLMSFGGKINRYSLDTYYSDRYARSCGIDAYPFYSDFYSDRFDRALYCGKAIVRIEEYVRKLEGFFPDDRILSHDIIEGAVLRSTSLKRCVYEDAPKTFAVDMARKMRWQRGDVQLLPYAFCNRVKVKDGRRVKNPIDPIYKLVIFINGASVIADFSAFFVMVIGIFRRLPYLTFFALTIYIGMYLFALIDQGRSLFSRIRIRHIFVGLLSNVRNLAEQLFLLPIRAILGLYIFIITTFKMLVHSGDLLSWVPFRTTQQESGLAASAMVTLPGYVILCAFALIVKVPCVLWYALFCGIYLILLLIAGRKKERNSSVRSNNLELIAIAKKIYKYFQDTKDDGLITDNLQFFPFVIRSKMTSPTNIGFSILAEVSACKLGIIDKEYALEKIDSIIEKTERLEKWNGHLYNWYNVSTFEPMLPKVVSTVDSSNFLASLIVAKSFSREVGDERLSERITKIIEATDFTQLIDPVDKMLANVFNVTENALQGKYDLLASEARLAYLIAISKGADVRGYFSLGREFSPEYGNTLLSWSGTAFEYMLPRLFVKSPPGSIMFVQELNSGRMQMKDKTDGVFGRSECGYRDFDNSTAYRYKAVGVRSLALSNESANVIAPYASFLYLSCYPKECLQNLRLLNKFGAEGEYGYYEAIDFDHNGEIVKSFMSHHQGMSLVAITNALMNDEIVRLFSDDYAIRSVRLLNAEENDYRLPPKVYATAKRQENESTEAVFYPHEPAELFWDRSEEYVCVQDALGRGYSKYGDYYITKFLDYKERKGGVFFQIKENGVLHSPTCYPNGSEKCYASIGEHCIRYFDPQWDLEMHCSILHAYNGELRKLIIRNDTDQVRSVEVSVYADIILNTEDGYLSHPAFSDMFVRAEYDEAGKHVMLYRMNDSCEVSIVSLMSLKGVEELRYNCNRYNVYGRTRKDHSDLQVGIGCTDAPPFGDVLYPCFAASGKVRVLPHTEAMVYCYLIAGKDVQSVRLFAERLDAAYQTGVIDLLGRNREVLPYTIGKAAKIGGALLYLYPSERTLQSLLENKNVRDVISRREKIIYYEIDDAETESSVTENAEICKALQQVGIENRFIVGERRVEGAGADSIQRLREQLSKIDPRIMILDKDEAIAYKKCALIDLSKELSEIPLSSESSSFVDGKDELIEGGYISGEGSFICEGYRVMPFADNTALPYCNVVGGEKGGFVITERGGGFTFGNNSREDKLSVWSGDPVEDRPSEMLYLIIGKKKYTLNRFNCTHKVGTTSFETDIDGRHILLNVYLIDKGVGKVFELIVSGEPFENARLSLEIYLALDWRYSDSILAKEEVGFVQFYNVRNGKECRVYASKQCSVKAPILKEDPFVVYFDVKQMQGVFRMVLSSGKCDSFEGEDLVKSRAVAVRDMCKNAIRIKSGSFSLDVLYNTILPYQVQSARLNAKTGFYQCSGATGFRDQLQDTVSLLLSDPLRVRKQLIVAAGHQYEEGDVQHWWHEPHIGVRTRISDDKLWLGYVAAKYISVTGDHSVLDEEIHFLSSPILGDEEASRYEIPSISYKKSLSEHILRAIRNALNYGEHDLLKIGTGDWNDGLDRVGAKGRGESVWLTLFAYATIRDCIVFYPSDVRKELSDHMTRLKNAVFPLLRGSRYPLCFTDEGEWLGYADTPSCTLALNPQTWSVLSGIVPDASVVLRSVKELIDPFVGIVKLSVPPFDEKSNHGYISAYPKGIRENGGQYTHAAIWYLKALLEMRLGDEAYELLMMLDPVEKCKDRTDAERYKGEPYVLAGDVYGFGEYLGRAGWSWYTGSAAWLKYTLTEDFLGIKKRGDKVYVKPCFPNFFRKMECKVELGENTLEIEYRRDKGEKLFVDGKEKEFIDLREINGTATILCYFI